MSTGIEMLQAVIQEHVQSYVVDLYTGETMADGRVQEGIQQQVAKDLAIFRLRYRDLMALPQGQYTSEDVKAYELGNGTIPIESVITFEGSKFRVDQVSDRNKDGGFTMYIAKKIGDNETSDE